MQGKEGNQFNAEMISLSGNETVPMWAIAARTNGRVKSNDDDDKRTRQERQNYQSKTRLESSMNMSFSSGACRVFRVLSALPLLFLLYS